MLDPQTGQSCAKPTLQLQYSRRIVKLPDSDLVIASFEPVAVSDHAFWSMWVLLS